MIRPSEKISIGAYYRSPLTVSTSGTGTLFGAGGTQDTDVEILFDQKWPQQFGGGIAVRPIDKLLVAAQFDWHGWSSMNTIRTDFVGQPAITDSAEIYTDWDNSYGLHLGVQYSVLDVLDVRAGITRDTRAVNVRTQQRQFLDGKKTLYAGGLSYTIGSWRVDTAFEVSPGGIFLIDDDSLAADEAGWLGQANQGPGEYDGQLYTFELTGQYLF
jgi:long-subunit fatty acid transport protein